MALDPLGLKKSISPLPPLGQTQVPLGNFLTPLGDSSESSPESFDLNWESASDSSTFSDDRSAKNDFTESDSAGNQKFSPDSQSSLSDRNIVQRKEESTTRSPIFDNSQQITPNTGSSVNDNRQSISIQPSLEQTSAIATQPQQPEVITTPNLPGLTSHGDNISDRTEPSLSDIVQRKEESTTTRSPIFDNSQQITPNTESSINSDGQPISLQPSLEQTSTPTTRSQQPEVTTAPNLPGLTSHGDNISDLAQPSLSDIVQRKEESTTTRSPIFDNSQQITPDTGSSVNDNRQPISIQPSLEQTSAIATQPQQPEVTTTPNLPGLTSHGDNLSDRTEPSLSDIVQRKEESTTTRSPIFDNSQQITPNTESSINDNGQPISIQPSLEQTLTPTTRSQQPEVTTNPNFSGLTSHGDNISDRPQPNLSDIVQRKEESTTTRSLIFDNNQQITPNTESSINSDGQPISLQPSLEQTSTPTTRSQQPEVNTNHNLSGLTPHGDNISVSVQTTDTQINITAVESITSVTSPAIDSDAKQTVLQPRLEQNSTDPDASQQLRSQPESTNTDIREVSNPTIETVNDSIQPTVVQHNSDRRGQFLDSQSTLSQFSTTDRSETTNDDLQTSLVQPSLEPKTNFDASTNLSPTVQRSPKTNNSGETTSNIELSTSDRVQTTNSQSDPTDAESITSASTQPIVAQKAPSSNNTIEPVAPQQESTTIDSREIASDPGLGISVDVQASLEQSSANTAFDLQQTPQQSSTSTNSGETADITAPARDFDAEKTIVQPSLEQTSPVQPRLDRRSQFLDSQSILSQESRTNNSEQITDDPQSGLVQPSLQPKTDQSAANLPLTAQESSEIADNREITSDIESKVSSSKQTTFAQPKSSQNSTIEPAVTPQQESTSIYSGEITSDAGLEISNDIQPAPTQPSLEPTSTNTPFDSQQSSTSAHSGETADTFTAIAEDAKQPVVQRREDSQPTLSDDRKQIKDDPTLTTNDNPQTKLVQPSLEPETNFDISANLPTTAQRSLLTADSREITSDTGLEASDRISTLSQSDATDNSQNNPTNAESITNDRTQERIVQQKLSPESTIEPVFDRKPTPQQESTITDTGEITSDAGLGISDDIQPAPTQPSLEPTSTNTPSDLQQTLQRSSTSTKSQETADTSAVTISPDAEQTVVQPSLEQTSPSLSQKQQSISQPEFANTDSRETQTFALETTSNSTQPTVVQHASDPQPTLSDESEQINDAPQTSLVQPTLEPETNHKVGTNLSPTAQPSLASPDRQEITSDIGLLASDRIPTSSLPTSSQSDTTDNSKNNSTNESITSVSTQPTAVQPQSLSKSTIESVFDRKPTPQQESTTLDNGEITSDVGLGISDDIQPAPTQPSLEQTSPDLSQKQQPISQSEFTNTDSREISTFAENTTNNSTQPTVVQRTGDPQATLSDNRSQITDDSQTSLVQPSLQPETNFDISANLSPTAQRSLLTAPSVEITSDTGVEASDRISTSEQPTSSQSDTTDNSQNNPTNESSIKGDRSQETTVQQKLSPKSTIEPVVDLKPAPQQESTTTNIKDRPTDAGLSNSSNVQASLEPTTLDTPFDLQQTLQRSSTSTKSQETADTTAVGNDPDTEQTVVQPSLEQTSPDRIQKQQSISQSEFTNTDSREISTFAENTTNNSTQPTVVQRTGDPQPTLSDESELITDDSQTSLVQPSLQPETNFDISANLPPTAQRSLETAPSIEITSDTGVEASDRISTSEQPTSSQSDTTDNSQNNPTNESSIKGDRTQETTVQQKSSPKSTIEPVVDLKPTPQQESTTTNIKDRPTDAGLSNSSNVQASLEPTTLDTPFDLQQTLQRSSTSTKSQETADTSAVGNDPDTEQTVVQPSLEQTSPDLSQKQQSISQSEFTNTDSREISTFALDTTNNSTQPTVVQRTGDPQPTLSDESELITDDSQTSLVQPSLQPETSFDISANLPPTAQRSLETAPSVEITSDTGVETSDRISTSSLPTSSQSDTTDNSQNNPTNESSTKVDLTQETTVQLQSSPKSTIEPVVDLKPTPQQESTTTNIKDDVTDAKLENSSNVRASLEPTSTNTPLNLQETSQQSSTSAFRRETADITFPSIDNDAEQNFVQKSLDQTPAENSQQASQQSSTTTNSGEITDDAQFSTEQSVTTSDNQEITTGAESITSSSNELSVVQPSLEQNHAIATEPQATLSQESTPTNNEKTPELATDDRTPTNLVQPSLKSTTDDLDVGENPPTTVQRELKTADSREITSDVGLETSDRVQTADNQEVSPDVGLTTSDRKEAIVVQPSLERTDNKETVDTAVEISDRSSVNLDQTTREPENLPTVKPLSSLSPLIQQSDLQISRLVSEFSNSYQSDSQEKPISFDNSSPEITDTGDRTPIQKLSDPTYPPRSSEISETKIPDSPPNIQQVPDSWSNLEELLNNSSDRQTENQLDIPPLGFTKNLSYQNNLISPYSDNDGSETPESTNDNDNQQTQNSQGQIQPKSLDIPNTWTSISELLGSNSTSIPDVNSFVEESQTLTSPLYSPSTPSDLSSTLTIKTAEEITATSQQLTEDISDRSSEVITEQDLENLARQIYQMILNKIEINQERWNGHCVKFSPLLSDMNVIRNKSVNSFYRPTHEAGKHQLGNISPMDNKLRLLSEEVYYAIRHRLEIDLETQVSCYTFRLY